jgi:hypothetical protein
MNRPNNNTVNSLQQSAPERTDLDAKHESIVV